MNETLEFKDGFLVDKKAFEAYQKKLLNYNKIMLYAEMQDLIGVARSKQDTLGPGSKEHILVFLKICEAMGILTNDQKYSKPELVHKIIYFASKYNDGLDFKAECTSTGDTITTHGYKLICYSIWLYKNTIELTHNSNPKPYVENSKSMINLYKDLNLEYYTVLAEFIDNSIASYENDVCVEGIETDPLTIHVIFDSENYETSENKVYIIDNAAGINLNSLTNEVFSIGNKKETTGLNVFGVGMKRAAFWWTDVWNLTTYTGGKAQPYKALNLIDNNSTKLTKEILGTFDKERRKLSDKFDNSRPSGTIIELRSRKNYIDTNNKYKYRVITKSEFYKICGALSSIYSDYLVGSGYDSPSGKNVKVNIHVTIKTSSGKITTTLEADEKKTLIYPEALNRPYWEEESTPPPLNAISKVWKDVITIPFRKNEDSEEVQLKMYIYLQSPMRENTATIAHVVRGKKLNYYRFGYKDASDKIQYDGQRSSPSQILGQQQSKLSMLTRGYIDFTPIGKNESGTSVDLSDSQLDEIYKKFGIELKKRDIHKMGKNYASKLDPLNFTNNTNIKNIPSNTVSKSKNFVVNTAVVNATKCYNPKDLKDEYWFTDLLTNKEIQVDINSYKLVFKLTKDQERFESKIEEVTIIIQLNNSALTNRNLRFIINLLVLYLDNAKVVDNSLLYGFHSTIENYLVNK